MRMIGDPIAFHVDEVAGGAVIAASDVVFPPASPVTTLGGIGMMSLGISSITCGISTLQERFCNPNY